MTTTAPTYSRPICMACRDGLCGACSGYTALPVPRTCGCYEAHADADPHKHPLTAAATNARMVEECKARDEHHLTAIGAGFQYCSSCRVVVTEQDPVTEWTT